MRRKNLCLLALTVTLVVGGAAASLGAMLQHEPHFYQNCQVQASAERKKLSQTFCKDALQLVSDVTKNREGAHWRHCFTEAQINSFFEEDFIRLGEAENLCKHGVTDPRIMLEDNKVRLAFRYNLGYWSAVISYDLRLWLVPREPNTLAVQILSRRVGALPVSSQALLSELAEVARRHNLNLETTIYRHEGYPVVLLRYQSDGPRPNTSLHCLKVLPASLTIAGGSTETQPAVCPDGKCLVPSAN